MVMSLYLARSLERIFDFTNLSHGVDGFSYGIGKLLNGLGLDPHEWINQLLLADCRWHCRFILLAPCFRPLDLLLDILVVGLDVVAKFEITQRILVAAKDLRLVGQLRELLNQRGMHLLGRSLEEAAATAQEQRVTRKNRLLLGSR
jgi:hypothetical protein